jgi:hypothetical protein
MRHTEFEVLQIQEGAEEMRHTKFEGSTSGGGSSPRWSNGGGGTAKFGGGGAALGTGVGKSEMWEGEGGKGAVFGGQTARGKKMTRRAMAASRCFGVGQHSRKKGEKEEWGFGKGVNI